MESAAGESTTEGASLKMKDVGFRIQKPSRNAGVPRIIQSAVTSKDPVRKNSRMLTRFSSNNKRQF